MTNLNLSIAVGDYDHIRDLTSGAVRVQGVDLTALNLTVEEMFFRFTKFQEWDISELSFAKALSLVSGENPWLVLIPVFPSRAFRHSSIYVRSDSGISSPDHLSGKKIGLPEWAQTAAIYSRGLLSHNYGVDLKSVNWFQAGVNEPGRKEKVVLHLPKGLNLKPMEHTSLSHMLLSGEIDAVLSARPPNAFLQHPLQVKRLIPNFREVELDYWKLTGIFPIMHVIAIKREVYEKNRWIAKNLLDGFEHAKQRSLTRAKDITASSFPLPWISEYAELSQSILGDDIWPYGLTGNEKTLEAFTQYAYEQGITSQKMNVEEIFAKECIQSVKV